MTTQNGRAFNEWLRAQLKAKKMSQRQLAQQSGVDHSTISRLIRGDRMPSLGTATKLARGLREIRDDADTAPYLGRRGGRAAEPDGARRVRAPRRRGADRAAGPPDHGVLPRRPDAPLRRAYSSRPSRTTSAAASGRAAPHASGRRSMGSGRRGASGLGTPASALALGVQTAPSARPPARGRPLLEHFTRARPGPPSTVRVSGTANAGLGAGVRDSRLKAPTAGSGRRRPTSPGAGLEPVALASTRSSARAWSAQPRVLGRSAARRRRSTSSNSGSHTNTRVAPADVAGALIARRGRPGRSSGKRERVGVLEERQPERIVVGRRSSPRRSGRPPRSASGQPPSGSAGGPAADARGRGRRAPRRSRRPRRAAPRRLAIRRTRPRGRARRARRREADPDQDEHDRVQERVVVVVRKPRDDDREARWPRRSGTPPPEHAENQPAHGRALAERPRLRDRQTEDRDRRPERQRRRRPASRDAGRSAATRRRGGATIDEAGASGTRRRSRHRAAGTRALRGSRRSRSQLVDEERERTTAR